MANWSDSEVVQLIELWGEEGVQEQLEGAKRNKHVYDKLAEEMQKKGSEKTGEQCRAKMKKLKLDYRKVKDKHNKTGRGRKSWKYLEAMDAVLGHRPATRPSIALDTLEDPELSDAVEEEEEGDTSIDQSSSSNTALEESTGDDEVKPSQPSSSGIKPEPGSSGIKGKKRKRTKEEKIEAVLTSVVKEVVDAQQQSDRMFLELEEKRMKFEADQRKQEHEFQLQMMSMLFGNHGSHGTHAPPGSYGSFQPYPGFQ